MKVLYYIYFFIVAVPLLLILTILTALITIVGSVVGNGHFWGYWPAHIWAQCFCYLSFVKVTVEGRNNIDRGRSYVFVANHQGAYDIFAIYGWLGHNFKWMMKKGLERIPLVGYSCRKAGHIFVDNSSASAVKQTMADAEHQLSDGMSVVVFPEGSRTFDGHIKAFRRGAYALAVEFSLPVVPVTIDGAFDVMPRTSVLPRPGHIHLTIHKPILASDDGHNLAQLMQESRDAIVSALPEKNR